jgi:hypothetical protein
VRPPQQSARAAPQANARSHLAGLRVYRLEGDDAQDVRALIQADTHDKFTLYCPPQAETPPLEVVRTSAAAAFCQLSAAAVDAWQPPAGSDPTKAALHEALQSLQLAGDPSLQVQCRYQLFAGNNGGRYELDITYPLLLRPAVWLHLRAGAGTGCLSLSLPERASPSLAMWTAPKEALPSPGGASARADTCMLVQFSAPAQCRRLHPRSLYRAMQRDPSGAYPMWVGRAEPLQGGGTRIFEVQCDPRDLHNLEDEPELFLPQTLPPSLVGLVVGGLCLLRKKRGAPSGLLLQLGRDDPAQEEELIHVSASRVAAQLTPKAPPGPPRPVPAAVQRQPAAAAAAQRPAAATAAAPPARPAVPQAAPAAPAAPAAVPGSAPAAPSEDGELMDTETAPEPQPAAAPPSYSAITARAAAAAGPVPMDKTGAHQVGKRPEQPRPGCLTRADSEATAAVAAHERAPQRRHTDQVAGIPIHATTFAPLNAAPTT